jgi:hypothetical protein
MKKLMTSFLTAMLILASSSLGAVITFDGGTATLSDSSTVTTTNSGLWDNVVTYVEDGMLIEFIPDAGYEIGTNLWTFIGDYYSTGAGTGGGPPYENAVIHAHDFVNVTIRFSKVDGSTFDLNYVDMTSNTDYGGGLASGAELSYISNGTPHLLPSSDWGLDYTYFGDPGDGVQRLWLDSSFDGITEFTLTTDNAYCFGMDNFYIDEEAPPIIPAPGAFLLGSIGVGLIGWMRRRRAI